MPIYLIRHGETALNAARILQPPDTPLSELGFAQAQALAQRMASTPIDCMVSSDLLRAIQTSQPMTQGRPAMRLHTSELLAERNLGDYRGQSYASLGVDILALKEAPPGGESMADFEMRVEEAFEYITELFQELREDLPDTPDPTLVIVSHGLVIRDMLARQLSLPTGAISPDHLANTSVTIFDGDAPHLVSLLNSSSHLEDGIRPKDASAFGG